MSVRVKPFRSGGWEVDIRTRLPNGERYRVRKKAPCTSKSAARRWGEARERDLMIHGLAIKRKEVPTLEEFEKRFIDGHCRANRHKPSGITSKQSAFRVHLVRMFGKKRLDQIRNEDVARLKAGLIDRNPATVNNALSVLSMTLKVAVAWGVIDVMPCTIKLLKVQSKPPPFYDFDEYGWVMEAAREIDPRSYAMVLLAGDAGLRRGELIGLELTDLDFRRDQITIQRSAWRDKVTETKGMEVRVVPMTERLKAALKSIRHLRGDRVFYSDAGEAATAKVLQNWMKSVQKKAKVKATGNLHLLRHTFCSHLAMRGAPALAIQKMAGHKSLQTTMRYMHLSPGEAVRAIKMLEGPVPNGWGDGGETTLPPNTKLSQVG